jgi:hypothetical protein
MRDPARLKREHSFYQQYLRDGRYARGSGSTMHHLILEEVNSFLEEVKQAALQSRQDRGL